MVVWIHLPDQDGAWEFLETLHMHHEKVDDLEASLIGYEAKETSGETEETMTLVEVLALSDVEIVEILHVVPFSDILKVNGGIQELQLNSLGMDDYRSSNYMLCDTASEPRSVTEKYFDEELSTRLQDLSEKMVKVNNWTAESSEVTASVELSPDSPEVPEDPFKEVEDVLKKRRKRRKLIHAQVPEGQVSSAEVPSIETSSLCLSCVQEDSTREGMQE
ncbi:hypothetical protein ZIOFF_069388 [Zingiber officinale]|uniref:Uncharacterized protein n=1 Tax=Zingiber officinale TaxID=94328 RepID=A0A8J5EPV9_ZINOF|nr:hypothetical protein ZIOFF_069388 [Zingiber officinale]